MILFVIIYNLTNKIKVVQNYLYERIVKGNLKKKINNLLKFQLYLYINLTLAYELRVRMALAGLINFSVLVLSVERMRKNGFGRFAIYDDARDSSRDRKPPKLDVHKRCITYSNNVYNYKKKKEEN